MGTTIRVRDGKRDIQDGPYADTKEQLGGYIILELPSLDEAIEWAAQSPVAALGAVPDSAEVLGLLSLMLYCESRRSARQVDGEFVPRSEQNTDRWSLPLIRDTR